MSGPRRLTAPELRAAVPKTQPTIGRRNGVFVKAESVYADDWKQAASPNDGPAPEDAVLSAALTQLWRILTEQRALRCNDGAVLYIRKIMHVANKRELNAHISVEQHSPNGTRITGDVVLAALIQALDVNVPGWRA